jgi:hypothetical protein
MQRARGVFEEVDSWSSLYPLILLLPARMQRERGVFEEVDSWSSLYPLILLLPTRGKTCTLVKQFITYQQRALLLYAG